MSGSSYSRRRILRTGAAAAGVGAVGSLAGCSSDSDGSSTNDPTGIDAVPEGADFVAKIDVEGIRTNARIESKIQDLLETFDVAPDSTSDVYKTVEDESGLDPTELQTVLAYGSAASAGGGAIIRSGWSNDDLTSAIEDSDTEFEQDTYEGTAIYLDDSGTQTTATALLGDGTIAVGTEGSVEDIIDVRNGEEDPVGGTVKEEYEAASSGLVRFGFQVPDMVAQQAGSQSEAASQVENGHGSLTAEDDDGQFLLEFELASEDAADQIVTQAQAALSQTGQQMGSGTSQYPDLEADMQAAIEATSISSSGSTVTIENSKGIDALVILGGAIIGSFVLGLGQAMGGETGTGRTPTAPQIQFSWAYDNSTETVSLTHSGGETVAASKLFLTGTGFVRSSGTDQNTPGTWQGSTSGTADGESAVVAGDTLTIGAGSDANLQIVYRDRESGSTAVLSSWSGPDA